MITEKNNARVYTAEHNELKGTAQNTYANSRYLVKKMAEVLPGNTTILNKDGTEAMANYNGFSIYTTRKSGGEYPKVEIRKIGNLEKSLDEAESEIKSKLNITLNRISE